MEYNREIARQQDHYDRALIKAEDAKLRRKFTTKYKLNIHPSEEQLKDNPSLHWGSLDGDKALTYPDEQLEDCFGYTDGIPDEYGQNEYGQNTFSWTNPTTYCDNWAVAAPEEETEEEAEIEELNILLRAQDKLIAEFRELFRAIQDPIYYNISLSKRQIELINKLNRD